MPTEELLLNTGPNSSVPAALTLLSTTAEENMTKLESNEDRLVNIINAQKQLFQVKESLGTIIDTITENPSIITRATTYYGEMSSWQKISLGVGLSIPTLAVGIFAQMGILLTISGATAVGYTASGIILDDHHRCSLNIAERVKAEIFSMADVLELTINGLETIRQKLAIEIEKFKAENVKLAENVVNLGGQVCQLNAQINVFKQTEKMLKQSKDSLESTVLKLQQSSTQQTELLKHNQQELEKVTNDYHASRLQLSEKLIELTTVKVSMGCEVEKAKKMVSVLTGAVSTLSGAVIADAAQRTGFQNKLDQFLSDKEANFDKVTERICNAERELVVAHEELKSVKEQLFHSVEQQLSLVNRQEKQIGRLETLYVKNNQVNNKPSVAALLNAHGINAQPKSGLASETHAGNQAVVSV